MKKILSVIMIILSLTIFAGCMSFVNTTQPDDKIPENVKEEKIEDTKEQQIEPILVQKISQDEAKGKVTKKYGGEGVIVKLSGEHKIADLTYYVFDLGADIDGMFSKDFSVVVDAQSGEMFEGTYNKETNKIIKY